MIEKDKKPKILLKNWDIVCLVLHIIDIYKIVLLSSKKKKKGSINF